MLLLRLKKAFLIHSAVGSKVTTNTLLNTTSTHILQYTVLTQTATLSCSLVVVFNCVDLLLGVILSLFCQDEVLEALNSHGYYWNNTYKDTRYQTTLFASPLTEVHSEVLGQYCLIPAHLHCL